MIRFFLSRRKLSLRIERNILKQIKTTIKINKEKHNGPRVADAT
jgi:hypothetical protein